MGEACGSYCRIAKRNFPDKTGVPRPRRSAGPHARAIAIRGSDARHPGPRRRRAGEQARRRRGFCYRRWPVCRRRRRTHGWTDGGTDGRLQPTDGRPAARTDAHDDGWRKVNLRQSVTRRGCAVPIGSRTAVGPTVRRDQTTAELRASVGKKRWEGEGRDGERGREGVGLISGQIAECSANLRCELDDEHRDHRRQSRGNARTGYRPRRGARTGYRPRRRARTGY